MTFEEYYKNFIKSWYSPSEATVKDWLKNAWDAATTDLAEMVIVEKWICSEALYSFAGYLTTRHDTLKVGATHNAAPMADLVNIFILKHNLLPPREGWEKY